MKRKTQDPRIAQKVIEMVAAHYKTTPAALKDDDGDRRARQVIMYTLREELGSPIRIAREVINVKSDPSVYAAIKTIKTALKTDTILAKIIEEIKTETLMIAAMLGVPASPATSSSSTRRTMSADGKPNLPAQPEAAPIVTTGNAIQVIGKVQKAVTGMFLGADLLQSRDPAAEVMLAKDAVVFLVWDDFPKITQAEILSAFHLDRDGLYRAIGRISVTMKEDGSELKKKLKAARAEYSPA